MPLHGDAILHARDNLLVPDQPEAAIGGGRVDDEMDEDDPAMSHDDALPELVDSSDDDEDGDEDVPLEDVPDLVDSSDDDAALETSMNVD